MKRYSLIYTIFLFTLAFWMVETTSGLAQSGSAAIIVGGRDKENDALQENIHYVTNNAYNMFIGQGYTPDDIRYYATDLSLDADGDGAADVNDVPSDSNLQWAITEWAVEKQVNSLTIYFMQMSTAGAYYLDNVNEETLTVAELDTWLDLLEQALPDVQINVIVDACYSGHFITSTPSVSAPNRLIITSSAAQELAWATPSGAMFSDYFIFSIETGFEMVNAYQIAEGATSTILPQTTQIDANGNGISNEEEDLTASYSHTLAPIPTEEIVTGDSLEPDNDCNDATVIETDGITQTHSFHTEDDIDWVTFEAISGRAYHILVEPSGSTSVDITSELYFSCPSGRPFTRQSQSPLLSQQSVDLYFTATVSGTYRLKLYSHDSIPFSNDATYDLSIKQIEEQEAGTVVIVAGRQQLNDTLQENIHNVTNRVYELFVTAGYSDQQIHYLASEQNPNDNQAVRVDAFATVDTLQDTLTNDVVGQLNGDKSLTIYLVGHGEAGHFYLDDVNNERLSGQQLDSWLDQLQGIYPDLAINIIIDTSYAGQFINDSEQTISGANRVVITSTSDDQFAWATIEGTNFSDIFLLELSKKRNLRDAFLTAEAWLASGDAFQQPWLDDNANGIPNEPDEGNTAEVRFPLIVQPMTVTNTIPLTVSYSTLVASKSNLSFICILFFLALYGFQGAVVLPHKKMLLWIRFGFSDRIIQ